MHYMYGGWTSYYAQDNSGAYDIPGVGISSLPSALPHVEVPELSTALLAPEEMQILQQNINPQEFATDHGKSLYLRTRREVFRILSARTTSQQTVL